MSYIAPQIGLDAFNCSRCQVYANQSWFYLRAADRSDGYGHQYERRDFRVSHCHRCGEPTIWLANAMIYPLHGNAAPPNPDMPEDVMADYEEAKVIANLSPRGAAALLRLAIQKLCRHLGGKGDNINEDIAELVKKGLPKQVQEALDSVRVIGNEAVHPGVLDLRDDPQIATALFGVVNFVCQRMISDMLQVKQLYDMLPADKRTAITKRDQK